MAKKDEDFEEEIKEGIVGKNVIKKVEKYFFRAVREFQMVKKGETIAVALSGGKDSSAGLYLMGELQKKLPFDLIAITINEGGEYREASLEKAKELCKILNVKHFIYSFRDEIGIELDEIGKKADNVCSYCGVFRRWLINRKAKELKAGKLVLAHNKDDFAQTFLMNILRNEPERIARFAPVSGYSSPKFVTRIRPLIYCEEEEVLEYAKQKKLPFLAKACPYRKGAFRLRVVKFLDALEKEYEGTKQNALDCSMFMMDAVEGELKRMKCRQEIRECKKCGEPSSEGICMKCRMLEEIKGKS